ncbi:hypothetical protein QWY79_06680 [Halomonas sabkhae]|nr:hypothetical protein [Halomonas sabkhae]MDN3524954.1 hypothetical protein [Halomonas sabkhae]
MAHKFVLVGDIGTDHEGFSPTPLIEGSPSVMRIGSATGEGS